MLEKPGAQNIIVCENQGKQCELNITENKLNRCFSKKKKNGDDVKKRQRLIEIQVLTKDFTSSWSK